MPTNLKTFDYGTLEGDSDTWLLAREHVTPLDIPFPFDTSLEHKRVSVIGRMGIPQGSPSTKLIVEKIVGHAAIAKRAYEISQSSQGTFANDNWLRAERELLAT